MFTFKEYMSNRNGYRLKGQVRYVSSILIDMFTIPPMPQRVGESVLPKAHSVTESFWLDTRSPLYGWLESLGVSAPRGQVPVYSEGGAGRAYFLGDKVVKMTTNRVESNVATMVAGRPDLPTPVIGVTYLGNRIYAILQHRVNTDIPLEMGKAADYMTVLIDDNPDMNAFPNSPTEQAHLCQEVLRRYGGDTKLLPHMMTMMMVLTSLYQATGYKHDDAGPSNISLHQGKVVIHDLGPNQGKGFDQLKSLSQIQKNRQSMGLPAHEPI